MGKGISKMKQYTLNGTQLAVEDVGTGPTALIFLHYYAGSSRAWTEVVGHLKQFYRCVAPDLRGFGASADAASGYTLDDGANDIAALVETLALDRYIFVGHSMGGKIALTLAARQPKGLRGLVLLAPSPPTPEPIADEDRQRLLDGYGQREQAESTAKGITAQPLSPDVLEQVIVDNLRSSHQAWIAWLERGSHEDIADRMPQLQVPVVVVVGEEDVTIPLDVQRREVLARLPQAHLHTVAQAAHLLPLEAPLAVMRAIQEVDR